MNGDTGDDRIRTGGGPDRVGGGARRDVIASGPGDDLVDVRDGERDRVRCGPGRDTVKADRFNALIGCELVNRVPARRRAARALGDR